MLHNPLKNEKGRFIYIKNEDGHFVCPQCGVVKQKQNTMNMHYHTHDETPSHTCKACKKGFLQKQALDLHIQSRHPELLKDDDSTKKFQCPFDDCNFSAITKGNCIIHCLRVHFVNKINKIMIKDEDTKTFCCDPVRGTVMVCCAEPLGVVLNTLYPETSEF